MKTTIQCCMLTVLLCFLLSQGAQADEALFLKDGSVIYGKVISESDDGIAFRRRGKDADEKFPRRNAIRILYNLTEIKKQYVYLKDGTYRDGYIVDEDANKIIVREKLTVNKEYSLKRSDIASISDVKIENRKEYVFRYSKPAKSVSLEGDFTGWRPVSMNGGGENWEKTVEIDILKKNEYQYRYIVDGAPGEKRSIKFKLDRGTLKEDIDRVKFTLGVKLGYAFYLNGYADRIEASPPMAGLYMRANLPFIWKDLAFQFEFNYLRHEPIRDENPAIESLMIETNNFILGGYFVYDIIFYREMLGLHPKIGAGYIVQSSTVSGSYSSTETNGVPFFGGGLEFTCTFKKFVSLNIGYQIWTEIEEGNYTILNAVTLGVGFRF
ncbi:MAG TPA: glycogen-binding domain-containing protein [Spirochaetota bacterium]|nr:glycogen-binding domain-containing protein [Spirochaetota bacterium]